MSKRRHHEEHQNHEAWAIPYGDLITLLLAFFVVMYALSTVNEGKYRVLSESLVAAFRGAPKSLEPVQVGELSRAFHNVQTEQPRTLVPLEVESMATGLDPAHALDGMAGAEESADAAAAAELLIAELGAKIQEELQELVDENLVKLRRDRYWIEIEINTSVLFPTASAELSPDAMHIMERLGHVLAATETRIQVEGHTDSLPIKTPVFPSNWELSAARAATVVRMFSLAGVEPARMAAVGFGEFHPVADNATEEGRSSNRRVVVVVVAARKPRYDEWMRVQRLTSATPGPEATPGPKAATGAEVMPAQEATPGAEATAEGEATADGMPPGPGPVPVPVAETVPMADSAASPMAGGAAASPTVDGAASSAPSAAPAAEDPGAAVSGG